ncbi:MAG: hypothetical protein NVSMB29_15710 [Candidatus Dormibacteria bacterium]
MPAVAGRTFTNGDTAVGAGLIVGLIALFLPWYSASSNGGVAGFNFSVSVNGFSHWTGLLYLLAVLVGLALFVVRHFVPTVKVPELPQPDAMLYLAIGAFMAVMAILYLLLGSGTTVSGPGYSAGPSFGLFIGLIAGIAVAAGGFLKRSEPQQVTQGYSTPSAGTTYVAGTPPPQNYGGGAPTPPPPAYGGGTPPPPSTYGGGGTPPPAPPPA